MIIALAKTEGGYSVTKETVAYTGVREGINPVLSGCLSLSNSGELTGFLEDPPIALWDTEKHEGKAPDAFKVYTLEETKHSVSRLEVALAATRFLADSGGATPSAFLQDTTTQVLDLLEGLVTVFGNHYTADAPSVEIPVDEVAELLSAAQEVSLIPHSLGRFAPVPEEEVPVAEDAGAEEEDTEEEED